MKNNLSTDVFIKTCNSSKSMAIAANKLSLPFTTFKRIAIELNCYKTNMSGKGLYKPQIAIDDIITNKISFSRCQLKKRLLREGLLENKCCKCGNDGEWLGNNLPLELDHINGVNNDNRIENLRILCPNCHSQTPTFRKKKDSSPEGNRTLKNTAS